MLRLWIKGCRHDAEAACKAHAVTDISHCEQVSADLTVVHGELPYVMAQYWFAEPASVPYPNGTLLWFGQLDAEGNVRSMYDRDEV